MRACARRSTPRRSRMAARPSRRRHREITMAVFKANFQDGRRDFLKGSAAVGGGLAVGFHLPSALAQKAGMQDGTEVNAWVVVNPDDTIVIRYARSEMGQ